MMEKTLFGVINGGFVGIVSLQRVWVWKYTRLELVMPLMILMFVQFSRK